MKWIHVTNAKKIASIPLKPWDSKETCFSWLYLFHGSDGHVYFCYDHEDAEYCPLKNIYIDYCSYGCKCEECPDSEFFVIVDGKKIPVKRLT